jgi:hypothetical protein
VLSSSIYPSGGIEITAYFRMLDYTETGNDENLFSENFRKSMNDMYLAGLFKPDFITKELLETRKS